MSAVNRDDYIFTDSESVVSFPAIEIMDVIGKNAIIPAMLDREFIKYLKHRFGESIIIS